MPWEARVLLSLLGLLIAAWGFVLVTDFRGAATFAARVNAELKKRKASPARLEQEVVWQLMMARVGGVVFMAIGAFIIFGPIFLSPGH